MTDQPTQSPLLNHEPEQPAGPVECLGLTFASDAERRAHFSALLAEKLKYPEFRKIEGFPIGTDEDILALSDPPHYTACPNPFIEDFVRAYGKPYDADKDSYTTGMKVQRPRSKSHQIGPCFSTLASH